MILFADTSALVKLYVQEAHSDAMQALAGEARMLAVSRIAWAETMAAFARRVREQPADAVAIEALRMRLRADWLAYAVIFRWPSTRLDEDESERRLERFSARCRRLIGLG